MAGGNCIASNLAIHSESGLQTIKIMYLLRIHNKDGFLLEK